MKISAATCEKTRLPDGREISIDPEAALDNLPGILTETDFKFWQMELQLALCQTAIENLETRLAAIERKNGDGRS